MADRQPPREGAPLPLVERPPQALSKPPGTLPGPAEQPQHEPTAWYRLVTALTSCYVYLVAHTSVNPCRFEMLPDGTGACYLGADRQWRVSLPEAACRQFELVVELWRSGRFNDSTQAEAMRLSTPLPLPGGGFSVAVTPASAKRTRTTVRRR